MAWTNVYSNNFLQASTSKANQRPPFVYFFETFLPTVGWTVTDGHSTASGLTNATDSLEDWWACSYTGLDYQGNSYTENIIYEFEYTQKDVHLWTWDGVAGSGGGTNFFTDTNYFLNHDVADRKWNIFTSDQNSDAFILTIDQYIQAFWFGFGCMYGDWSKDGWAWFPDSVAGGILRDNNASMNFGLTRYFNSPQNLITSQFGLMGDFTYGTMIGVNVMPDLLMRFSGTTTAYASSNGGGSGAPAVVQFNGINYIDYGFGQSRGLMLDIGSNDYSSEISF